MLSNYGSFDGLGKDGEGQQKIADAFDSISRAIRGEEHCGPFKTSCQNAILYAVGGVIAYKVLMVALKGRN